MLDCYLQEQRQLEARYEKLIAQRSTLKGLANKSRYKEVRGPKLYRARRALVFMSGRKGKSLMGLRIGRGVV